MSDSDKIVIDMGSKTAQQEIEELEASRHFLPYKFSYISDQVAFSVYDNETRTMTGVTGSFEILVAPYGIKLNDERLSRMCDVIDAVDGAVFLPSNSDINALYLGGTLSNPTFEIPSNVVTPSMAASFLYYKCEAVLGNYANIILFKFVPANERFNIYVDIQAHRKLNPYIDEDEWVSEMVDVFEELQMTGETEMGETLETYAVPWWHRDDTTTRDYYYGLGADVDPNTLIINLTPTAEDEWLVYPLYTEDYLSKFLDIATKVKDDTLRVDATHSGDIVEAHKSKLNVHDVIEILSAALNDTDEDDDDDSDFVDGLDFGEGDIIIGGGVK